MPEENEQLQRGRFEGEVIARLTSIDGRLGEITSTASAAAAKANSAAELAASASATQADHEARLRAIEERNANEKGKSSALSAAIAGAISVAGIAIQWIGK